ncbi:MULTISPECIES: FecR domain-containing protein [unclassified Sphingomonas]|uniref:FecR family protein n=1 Tax=unclassified Sphingomonas TaxID=196159 RepID=UPI00226ABB66
MQTSDDIIDQATLWQLRQPTLDAAGWEAFVLWLEASPAHAVAMDRVALADRLIADARPSAPAAGIPVLPMRSQARHSRLAALPRRRIGWGIAGTAIAASLALLLMPLALPRGAQPYVLTTAPGEHRTVRLDDGTEIAMNGGTRLRLDHADQRVAVLDRGQAMFRVHHDEGKAFTLVSGDLSVRDMGTVFDVTRTGDRLDVQVAEGSVMFQPDGDAIVLKRGHALTAREDRHSVALATVAPETVGGWQQGQIAFVDETVSAVFAAVERRYGTKVVLEHGLPERQFTGMVALSGSVDRDIPHLATLIGAKARRNGEQWVLAP